MTIERAIVANGLTAHPRAAGDHLGQQPDGAADVFVTGDRRVDSASTPVTHELSGARGKLRRRGQRTVSLQEMLEAIEISRAR